MFFSCDGSYSVDESGSVACSNWVAVADSELLGFGLTVEDYELLAGFGIRVMLVAFAIRLTLKLLIK